MKPLSLSTTKSLYKPIEIEIDGKKYQALPITRKILQEMGGLEKKIRAGNAECAYEQVELLFGTNHVFDKLDLRQINEIVGFVTAQLFRPERIAQGEDPKAKNRKRPGSKE